MKALSYSVSHCVSAERIWQELTKTDQDFKFKEAMLLFYRLGLLEYLFGLDIDPLFLQKRLSEIPVFLPLVLKLTLLWSHETLFSKDCLLKLSELKISRKDLFLLEQVEKGLMWLDTKADPLISLEMIQWAQKSGDDLDSLSLVLSILRGEKASKIFWKLLLEHPLTSYLRERGPLFKAGDLIPYQIPPGKKMGALLHWLHEQAAKHQSIDKAYLLSLLEKEQEGQFLLMEAQKGTPS
jgi:tRNA nucleotidyltransferase/poly(A) polymerase